MTEPNLVKVYELPNGCTIYIDTNPHPAGGRCYYSDEGSGYEGGPYRIWDTCLSSKAALLAVILAEERYEYFEKFNKNVQERIKKKAEKKGKKK